MNKKCFAIILLLLMIIAGGTYKFIFQGNVSKSSDGRTSILLSADERDLVLAEMRLFLISVQKINTAIAEDNMPLAAEAARKVGKAAQGEVPGTLIGKLPLLFKQLGFATHSKFDQLAMDLEDLGDANHSLSQLSALMHNCVTCHETYRIDLENQ